MRLSRNRPGCSAVVLLAAMVTACGRSDASARSDSASVASPARDSAARTLTASPGTVGTAAAAAPLPGAAPAGSTPGAPAALPAAPGAVPPGQPVAALAPGHGDSGLAPAAAPGAPPAAAPAPVTSLAPAATAAVATPTPGPAATTPAPAPAARLAFGPGERLEYQVKYGPLGVGSAVLHIVGSDEVRGVAALHTTFTVQGGVRFYKVDDRYESWFDPRSFSVLRFNQSIDEGKYERERHYEVFPERRTFSENGKPEQPSVAQPLDETSFIYFLRTVPLGVGRTYDFDRYFKPEANPVRVRVLRRERVSVPAGTFDAIVVQPIIKTKGLFSEGGRAEVWFTDDSARTLVQLKSQLKFGSLNLYLRSVTR